MVPGYQGRNLALAQAAAGQVLESSIPLPWSSSSSGSRRGVSIPGTRRVGTRRSPRDLRRGAQPRWSDSAGGGPSRPGPGPRRRLLPGRARGEGRDRHRGRACSGLLALRLHRDPAPRASRDRGGPEGGHGPRWSWPPSATGPGSAAEAIADPIEAWERARQLAKARNGVALAAGSHYLLSCIWTERPAQSS